IFGEETVRREGASEEENPYWLDEEPQPHPNPELGCIRRGLCCKSSPGWFGPGEVEAAAAFMDMAPDDFVRRYIVIDRLEIDGQTAEVFVPVKLGRDGEPLMKPGTRVDDLYRMLRSPCVFFENNGCVIYGARPSECRRYICTNTSAENLSHRTIAEHWLRGEPISDD